jgi:hypothetical protein
VMGTKDLLRYWRRHEGNDEAPRLRRNPLAHALGLRNPYCRRMVRGIPRLRRSNTHYGIALYYPIPIVVSWVGMRDGRLSLASNIVAYAIGGLLILAVIWGGVYHFKM